MICRFPNEPTTSGSAPSSNPDRSSIAARDTHLVLIPSYNTGPALLPTVRAALAQSYPVWVVIDGSTDGSDIGLVDLSARIIRLPRNGGKGYAVRAGLLAAIKAGYTHALTFDADGQHPAERIGDFMRASAANPDAMILGQPIFGPDAPWIRVMGRKLCNRLVQWEAGTARVQDSLFGFRVYPIAPLLQAMAGTRRMRGFDFDPEAVVRLCQTGCRTINLPANVRYLCRDQGGVSHFHYLRDNLLLSWMHARLLAGLFLRQLRR